MVQEIFNTREIAIGIWLLITLAMVLLIKSLRKILLEFLKSIVPILLCKKFIVFYVVFIAFLLLVIQVLQWTTFWDTSQLKDTILWVIFVELPLFGKAIQEAKDNRFFSRLIANNLKFIAFFEFFVDFWTFNLWIELIIVPVTVLFSIMYALASREKKHKPAKLFFDGLLAIWGVIITIHAISSTIRHPELFFNWDTLKSLVLPILLLILNLPVVYGLALYNGYEQLFIKIKSGAKDKWKMKFQILAFAGISLPRVSAIRRNLQKTIHISLNADDMKRNLKNLENHLGLQIGDNYMKRAKFYICVCMVSAIASLVGLVLANSGVSVKDIITLNFVFNIPRIKEILTYIFSVSLVFSISLLLYAIGFSKKKFEEITQIKKYAIFDFLFALKKQRSQLQEHPPIDDPVSLYVNYIQTAYELKEACTKALNAYGNLLNIWERESIESLQTSAIGLFTNATIGGGDFLNLDVSSFCKYYHEKIQANQHSAEYNSFSSMIKTDAERYTKLIEITYEDFKKYYE